MSPIEWKFIRADLEKLQLRLSASVFNYTLITCYQDIAMYLKDVAIMSKTKFIYVGISILYVFKALADKRNDTNPGRSRINYIADACEIKYI